MRREDGHYSFTEHKGIAYRYDYVKIAQDMNACVDSGDTDGLLKIINVVGTVDLFFLLYFVLDIQFVNTRFHVPKIYEVQDLHSNTLDLWAREHGKTTILTFGLIIWEIINDPTITIGIFSHTRSIAKGFLRRIKLVMETNARLKGAWPDIFWENPERQAQKWSEDDGIIVKRDVVLPEATIEAWGHDSMPVSKHFKIIHNDDLETEKSDSTPEQLEKSKEGFRSAMNLGQEGGIIRTVGTIYHYAGLHQKMMESGDWIVRFYPGEDEKGNPVLWTREALDRKRKIMGPYVYSTQILLKPISADNVIFVQENLKYFETVPSGNCYITVDPAGNKKGKGNDFWTAWVHVVDQSHRVFVVDGIRDCLSLGERWEKLLALVLRWMPMEVGYEEYGSSTDVEYMNEKMVMTSQFFTITPLKGNEANRKKNSIESMVPRFEQGLILLPRYIPYKDTKGKSHDLVQEFIMDEYLKYPFCEHDDMLDCMARIFDPAMKVTYPMISRPEVAKKKPGFNPLSDERRSLGWMAQ